MLIAHLIAALASDILVMTSALVSVAYLMQDRLLRNLSCQRRLASSFPSLPSLQLLDNLGIKLLSSAFILMTLGIILGSIMAYQAWGPMWYLDPRQIWSTITWLLFAFVLVARATVGWRGRRAAWVTLVGTSLVVIGVMALNYGMWTRHGS